MVWLFTLKKGTWGAHGAYTGIGPHRRACRRRNIASDKYILYAFSIALSLTTVCAGRCGVPYLCVLADAVYHTYCMLAHTLFLHAHFPISRVVVHAHVGRHTQRWCGIDAGERHASTRRNQTAHRQVCLPSPSSFSCSLSSLVPRPSLAPLLPLSCPSLVPLVSLSCPSLVPLLTLFSLSVSLSLLCLLHCPRDSSESVWTSKETCRFTPYAGATFIRGIMRCVHDMHHLLGVMTA